MPNVDSVLKYARQLAEELGQNMQVVETSFGGVEYIADDHAGPLITARTVAALEFFRQYAGFDSAWTQRATSVYEDPARSASAIARTLGSMLRAWSDQVDGGIVEIVGARAWVEVGIVSTDVMGQVRRLLEDNHVHPAAPIVLCGAALEITLRSVAEGRNLALPAHPTMRTLTGVLRAAGLLTVQDVKDLEAVAGVRNQAAHGDFDALSTERAGLMEQQTNLLLSRLAGLIPQL